jgi:hypothetical protein
MSVRWFNPKLVTNMEEKSAFMKYIAVFVKPVLKKTNGEALELTEELIDAIQLKGTTKLSHLHNYVIEGSEFLGALGQKFGASVKPLQQINYSIPKAAAEYKQLQALKLQAKNVSVPLSPKFDFGPNWDQSDKSELADDEVKMHPDSYHKLMNNLVAWVSKSQGVQPKILGLKVLVDPQVPQGVILTVNPEKSNVQALAHKAGAFSIKQPEIQEKLYKPVKWNAKVTK